MSGLEHLIAKWSRKIERQPISAESEVDSHSAILPVAARNQLETYLPAFRAAVAEAKAGC
jgi:hypothetical protein